MTTITNAIKPTIMITSPTPSNQFTARLPTTFLPVRTKPLSTSSKPLSVTVKCSNNPNLPNKVSNSEDGELMERMVALIDQIYEKYQRVRELRLFYMSEEMTDEKRRRSKEYFIQAADALLDEIKVASKALFDYIGSIPETGGAMLSPEDFQRFRAISLECMLPEYREEMNGVFDAIESEQDPVWQVKNQLQRGKNWLVYGTDYSR